MDTTQERREQDGVAERAAPPQGAGSTDMLGSARAALGAGALQRKIQRRAATTGQAVVQRKTDPTAPAPEAPIGAPAAAPGLGGMLTAATTVKLDGKDVSLAAGTVVEVVSKVAGGKLHVKVYSHHGGAQCDIPEANFKAEPAVAHKDFDATAGRQDDVSFRDMRGPLFGPSGNPEIGDVNQGYLGDCYLISAMGAVAAQSPDAIKSLFSPQTPNQAAYTISLYQLGGVDAKGKKTFKRVSYTVDSFIPVYTKADGTPGARPHYAGQLNGDMSNQAAGAKPPAGAAMKPLWPILLEKAYAIHRGGYQGGYADIGDQGGNSPVAMEALTGVASNPPAVVPASDEGVIQKFKQYQTDHVAVTCGTLDHQSPAAASFSAGADGQSFSIRLHAQGDDATETSEIKKNTIHIRDKKGVVSETRDNGRTLVGPDIDAAKCSVSYGDGDIKVAYKAGKKPAAADLQATADMRGVLNKDLHIHSWHAYMFEKVDEKAKLIYFKNPWGTDHPKRGVTPTEFRTYFTGIDTNNIREKPAGK